MNSIFIVTDIDINKIFNDKIPNEIGYYNVDGNDIITQYLNFRSRIKSIDNTDYNSEILFIYLNMFSTQNTESIIRINKLFNNRTFLNDVTSLYSISILDDLSSNVDAKVFKSLLEANKKSFTLDKIELFNILLSRENAQGLEVSLKDTYSQVEKILLLMHKSYPDIYDYLKRQDFNEGFLNSFGTASLSFPNTKIKESILYLNNASQLYFLLTNNNFTKDEYYSISSDTRLSDENTIGDLLKTKYSSKPDTIHIIESVNNLYEECKIDDIKSTFDNIESYQFFDYTKENKILSTVEIESTHNDYMIDIVHRTKNSIKATEAFFSEIKTIFKDYRNDKIISIQADLNRQKKEKISFLKKQIEHYSNELIQGDQKNVSNYFGKTTSFEALTNTLNYFCFGLETDDDFDHDKNITEKIKTLNNETSEERAVKRRRLFKEFEDLNNSSQEAVQEIDSELEDTEGGTGFRKIINLRKELSLSVIDSTEGFFSKSRYSFVFLVALFSVLAVILVFILSVKILDLSLKHSLYTSIIPIIIGGILIITKILEYKKYRKYIGSLVQQKVNYLDGVIYNHDVLIKNYLEQIKIEYTLEILKDIQNYCKIKIYKLENFRKYLFNHYLYSINKYEAIDFKSSSFEYSLFSKKQVENHFFEFNNALFFENDPTKKNTFYNLYLEKSKREIEYNYKPSLINIDFFDENEMAYDRVEAIEKHKLSAIYHNEYKKEPVLFLSDENSLEPIILEDIKQGDVGNCYFMAAIGAIAHTNPAYIRKMITTFDQSDKVLDTNSEVIEKSYLVRFFDSNSMEKYVAIDNKFWFYKDTINPVYSDFAYTNENKLEIWPMILEKAWAKINKGYENIIGSNKKQRKLDFGLALSGNYIDYKNPSDYNDVELFNIINDKINSDIPVVVYSKETVLDDSVVSFHAYTIQGVSNNKINIYNPHGKDHLKDKSTGFFRDNFDVILFFNLEDTSELIPQYEQVENIDHIIEIENDMNSFFGNELFNQIQRIPINELIDKNEFRKVLKRIDKASIPLFNTKEDKDSYLILFSDVENLNVDVLKYKPNDKKPQIDNDTYLLLSKFQSWKM